MMKAKNRPDTSSKKKGLDDHLSMGTAQNTAQAGDGTATPLSANHKEDDPSMRKDANPGAATSSSKLSRKV